jgi:hypothetical protein
VPIVHHDLAPTLFVFRFRVVTARILTPTPAGKVERHRLHAEWSLAAASLAPMAGGLVATRAIGATGVASIGYLASVQTVAAMVSLVSDGNVGPSIVREASRRPEPDATAIAKAGRRVTIVGGLFVLVVAALLGRTFGEALLGVRAGRFSLTAAAAAGALSMYTQQEINILSARRRTRAMASLFVLQGVVLASLALVLRQGGVTSRSVEAFVVACALLTAVAATAVARNGEIRGVVPTPADYRSIVSAGPILTLAVLFGSGATMAVPLIARAAGGYQGAGEFRIAAMIGSVVSTVGSAVTARVWFVRSTTLTAAELAPQMRAAIVASLRLAIPLAIAGLAFAPQLGRLLASTTSSTAAAIRVRVVAELVRCVGLCGSSAVLARCAPRRYVALEISGALVIVISTIAGARLAGVLGVGLGFGVACALYACFAFIAVWPEFEVAP